MKDCTINAIDLIKVYGTATPLTASLYDNNTPLPNRTLILRINGVDYRRTTDSTGKVSLNINLIPGTYPTTIKFNGDSTYNSATKEVVVRVMRNDTPQQTSVGKGNYFEVNKIPLKVVLHDGFTTTPGTSVKETDLLQQSHTLNAPTFYFNQGDHGVEFDISVVIKESYYYNTQPVADYLNGWNKTTTPVSVVTNAMDVPNSKYILTIKSKKQTNHYHSIWKLHFHQFYENNLSFENLYSEKTASLSAEDQILLKYQFIDKNSPKEAILALQKKLVLNGCWTSPYGLRKPNGVWDDTMPNDINNFENMAFGSNVRRNGICDRDVITALVTNVYDFQAYIRGQDYIRGGL
jgi:hypothetical protein